MTLEGLIAEFRSRTRDEATPYLWSDQFIAGALNEAEQEASIRAKLLRASDILDVVADNRVVSIGNDLFDIQYAELRVVGEAYGTEIIPTTHDEATRVNPRWRTESGVPTQYIHSHKGELELACVPDQGYELYVEYFRLPSAAMEADDDEPEISVIHHLHLVDWAEFRAYSIPDADTFNANKAEQAERRFDRHFGRKPSADTRRRQNANRPHRNKLAI